MQHRVCLAPAGLGARFLGQQTTASRLTWRAACFRKSVLSVAPCARQKQLRRCDRGRVAHKAKNVLSGPSQKTLANSCRVSVG